MYKMKAAVIYKKEGTPILAEVPEPSVERQDDLIITVNAAALKHIDKSRAKGTHYSTHGDTADSEVIGSDGVGYLNDGTRVYAIGTDGMIAEKALINRNRMVLLPSDLDDVTAAALPNAVIGSAMGLRFKACVKTGETVLINGATGFTGKIAIQMAKYYGAGKVVATGRNAQSLQSLLQLGADEIVSLKQDDEAIISQIKDIHSLTPIDVIIDYLWGHTAELILSCLKGKGAFTRTTRFVSIGAVTGDIIRLSAENLRSVDLRLSGSGLGSWSMQEVGELFTDILPTAFKLAAANKLVVPTIQVNLKDIEKLWDMDVPDGVRLVVTM